MQGTSELGSNNIIAFVTICDAEGARRFYGDTLGLRLVAEELPFALVFDAHGTMLRLAISPQHVPLPSTILGWRVDRIEVQVRGLAAAGVVFERYEGMSQDELGIWSTPTGAKVAWFKDPDGNVLSLTQLE